VLYFALLLYYFTRCFLLLYSTASPRVAPPRAGASRGALLACEGEDNRTNTDANAHLPAGQEAVARVEFTCFTRDNSTNIDANAPACWAGGGGARRHALPLYYFTRYFYYCTQQEAVARVVMRFHFTTLLGTLLLYSTGGGGARRHALPLYYFTRYFYYCTQQEAVARVVMRFHFTTLLGTFTTVLNRRRWRASSCARLSSRRTTLTRCSTALRSCGRRSSKARLACTATPRSLVKQVNSPAASAFVLFGLATRREARQACIEFTCFTRDRDASVSWRLVQKHKY
jgi:hypothetical protein